MQLKSTQFVLIVVIATLSTSMTQELNSRPKQRSNGDVDSHGNFHYSGSDGPAFGHRRILSRSGRVLKNVNLPNHWEKIPYKLQTYNEPGINEHERMPMLSNGFLGTTVKNTSVYIDGLYNGVGSESHRVRVPSLTAVEAIFVIPSSEITTYTFNCRSGIYETKTTTDHAILTHNIYVHRKLKNLIVTEIRLQVRDKFPVAIKLHNITNLLQSFDYISDPVFNPNRRDHFYQEFNPENITYEHRVIKPPTYYKERRTELNDGVYYLTGKVPLTEVPNRMKKDLHIYYTNIPNTIVVYPNATRQQQYFHFIQSTDTDQSQAKRAYDEAIRMIERDPTSLITQHVQAWEETWNKNGLAMIQDRSWNDQKSEAFKLTQQLYASFYNIYASIPYESGSKFYGLSPSGLAYGGLRWHYFNQSTHESLIHQNKHKAEGYGGHVTYHQEFWVLPLVSLFSPEMAKTLIDSRLRRSYTNEAPGLFDQAKSRARTQGYKGVQYSSEQGEYGVEVSPYKDAEKKIHTTGDISFGLRCYLRMTHSREFLQQSVSSEVSLNGEEYVKEFAEFWSSRMEYNDASNQYVIDDVSFGEKPQTREVNNEAFTNFMALLSMDTYKYALTANNKNPYDPQTLNLIQEYDERMNRINIPYDDLKQLILEYDGYNNGQRNEETFVPFLNYPVHKQMTYMQKKSIYDTYVSSLPEPNGNNMLSYASFLVGYMELNEEQKAKDYMKKQSSHFSEPFQVLSEYAKTVPSIDNNYHYLPGYASFVHSFISAFCNLRVRDFQLDLIYPSDFFDNYQNPSSSSQYASNILKQPFNQAENWNITGLNYRGNKLDILYDFNGKTIIVKNRPHIGGNPSDKVAALEIVTYEGSEVVTNKLSVGQTKTLRLNSDVWKYSHKKYTLQRLHHSTGYSDNINILASIYASEDYSRIDRPSSGKGLRVNSGFMLISATLIVKIKWFGFF